MRTLGLVFLPGELPPRWLTDALVARDPWLVAADSGLHNLLGLGLVPHRVVGDMDSVDPLVLQRLVAAHPGLAELHPTDKDHTDTELALLDARAMGAEKLVILGGGGGRLDHSLGLVSLFDSRRNADGELVPMPDYWYTANEEIFLIRGTRMWQAELGETISFFALDGDPGRVVSEGLVWDLAGVGWKNGWNSISNRAACATIRVEVDPHRGGLLCVRTLGKARILVGLLP